MSNIVNLCYKRISILLKNCTTGRSNMLTRSVMPLKSTCRRSNIAFTGDGSKA